jgi:hypothetical protein
MVDWPCNTGGRENINLCTLISYVECKKRRRRIHERFCCCGYGRREIAGSEGGRKERPEVKKEGRREEIKKKYIYKERQGVRRNENG